MTAVTLAPVPVTAPGGVAGGKSVVLQLWCCYFVVVFVPWNNVAAVAGLLFGNHIVDASSLVIFVLSSWCERLLNPFTKGVCGVSYRPISTGQLHPSQGFHTRPINPIIYREP